MDVLEREKNMRGYEMLHDLKKMPDVEHGVCFPERKIKAQRTVRSGEAWKGVLYCFGCIMICLGCMKKGISVLEMLT